MPWMIQDNCVHKKNADGSAGELVKCHDDADSAQKHLAALYAAEGGVEEYDHSLSDFVDRARMAFDRWMAPANDGPHTDMRAWVTDVFEDHVVVRRGEQKYFRVPMTVDGDTITFAPQGEWEAVRLSYVSEMDEGLTAFSVTTVAELGTQTIPDVPTAPGVDMTVLTEGDETPFFITQPLAPDGTVSKNGLLYDAELGESIVRQIMTDKPGGIMGHIPPDQKDTTFPVSQVHWIGAHRQNGQTWIKGYIPRTFPEVREEYRIERAKGGKAATSIYGKAIREFQGDDHTVWRAKDFVLDQLDLAPYKRAAAPGSGAFAITSEMETGDPVSETHEEKTMPDKATLLAELTAEDIKALPVFQSVREAILAEYAADTAETEQIAELQATTDTQATRIQELEADNNAQALLIQEFQTQQFTTQFEAKIAELTDWKVADEAGQAALGSLRGVMKNMALAKLGDVREMEQASTTLETLMAEDLKALIEMTRDRLAGPPAIVPGANNRSGAAEGPIVIEDTPEARQAAASKMAFKKG